MDQNFFPPPEVDVLRWHRHTDRTIDRQTDNYGTSKIIIFFPATSFHNPRGGGGTLGVADDGALNSLWVLLDNSTS